MSVATDLPPAVSVPVRARQVSRAAVSDAPALPPSRPRLRLVPPVEARPAAPGRAGRRRGAGYLRRPAPCPPVTAVVLDEVGIAAGRFSGGRLAEAESPVRPVRLTRRGVVVLAVAVALAGGLLLLTAHLSAGSPAARPAIPPGTVVTVQPGDTLWSIAGEVAPGRDPRRVVEQLRRSNHLDSVSLTPGQTLKVG